MNNPPLLIERILVVKAPLQKVWQACATQEGFKSWFTEGVEGEWKAGQIISLKWPGGGNEIRITELTPPHRFSYRWHPGGYHSIGDHPEDELTTVTFNFRSVEGGTEIHLCETGFENIPDDRKLNVLGMNTEGWDEELENVRKFLER